MFIKIKYYFTEFLFCFGIGNAKKKIRKLSLLLHDCTFVSLQAHAKFTKSLHFLLHFRKNKKQTNQTNMPNHTEQFNLSTSFNSTINVSFDVSQELSIDFEIF